MQARTNGAGPPRGHTSADARRLEGLADLASNRDPVERTLALAREALGMDVAFVSEFAGDRLEFRAL